MTDTETLQLTPAFFATLQKMKPILKSFKTEHAPALASVYLSATAMTITDGSRLHAHPSPLTPEDATLLGRREITVPSERAHEMLRVYAQGDSPSAVCYSFCYEADKARLQWRQLLQDNEPCARIDRKELLAALKRLRPELDKKWPAFCFSGGEMYAYAYKNAPEVAALTRIEIAPFCEAIAPEPEPNRGLPLAVNANYLRDALTALSGKYVYLSLSPTQQQHFASITGHILLADGEGARCVIVPVGVKSDLKNPPRKASKTLSK